MTEIPKGIPRGWRFVLWQGGRWALGGSLAGALLGSLTLNILYPRGLPEHFDPVWAHPLVWAWMACFELGLLAFLLAVNPLGAWPSRRSSDLGGYLLGWALWLPWFAFSCWLVYSHIALLSHSSLLMRYSFAQLRHAESRLVPYPFNLTVLSFALLVLMIWYPLLTNYHFNPFWPLWVKGWREAISGKPREVAPHAS